ncbi:MAG: ATP:cob(I)alamin adenosyltransferase [Elusimicrobia bacterium]|nr:ATP:cob(I)alamin adenosyltransferase [Elusimicrobiota bacterium]
MPKDFKPDMGKGDLGFTDLFGGRRVPKTDRRIKLNALLDDLSALLGLLKTGVAGAAAKKELTAAQKSIIAASALIAGLKTGPKPDTAALEGLIAAAAAKIRPPQKFALPGANETEALAHYARAKARVCEILAWEIKAKAPAVYLNRLSDYLFLVAIKHSRGGRKARK